MGHHRLGRTQHQQHQPVFIPLHVLSAQTRPHLVCEQVVFVVDICVGLRLREQLLHNPHFLSVFTNVTLQVKAIWGLWWAYRPNGLYSNCPQVARAWLGCYGELTWMCRWLFLAMAPSSANNAPEQDRAKRGVTTGFTRGYCPENHTNDRKRKTTEQKID